MKEKRKHCQPAKRILTVVLAIALVLSPSLLTPRLERNSAGVAYADVLEANVELQAVKVDELNDKLVLALNLSTTPECGLSGIEFKLSWPEAFKLTNVEDKGLLGEGDKGTHFSSKELTDKPYYIAFGNMDESAGGVSHQTGAIAYFTFEPSSASSLTAGSYSFSLQDVHAVTLQNVDESIKTQSVTIGGTQSYTYEATAGNGEASGTDGKITVSETSGTPQVKTSTIESAISSADDSSSITLDASGSNSLALSKTGAAAVAGVQKSMTVKTNAAEMTFDTTAVGSIGSKDGGEKLVINTSKEEAKIATGEATTADALKFTVTAELVESSTDTTVTKTPVTSFGGGKVKVSLDLPESLRSVSELICWNYTTTNYTVVNGSVQDDKYVFETNHFSDYIVGASETLKSFKGTRTEGVTVSGTVTSYGSEDENVTVELIKSGATEAAYTDTKTGNSATYSMTGVASGTYTLKVSKKGHAAWTETIEVSNDVKDKNVRIQLYGDVNGDGKVTAADAQEIQRYAAKLSSVFDAAENKEYCKKCANVNGDSSITAADAQEIQRYAAKLTSAIDKL